MSKTRTMRRRSVFVAAVAAAAAATSGFLPSRASAAEVTWDGGGGDNNWTTPQNWLLDAIPLAGDTLTFAGNTQTTNNNNFAANTSFGTGTNNAINFASGASSFTLGGNAVLLGGNVVNSSTSLQTINLPLTFAANRTINGGTGGIVLAGNLHNSATTGTQILTLSGAGTLTATLSAAGTVANGISEYRFDGAGTNWSWLGNATTSIIGRQFGFRVTNGATLTYGSVTDAPQIEFDDGFESEIGIVGNGTMNMVNGKIILRDRLNTRNGATYTQSGGTMEIWQQIQISNAALVDNATFTVNGGMFDVRNGTGSATAGGTLFLASRGDGTFNLNGGTVRAGILDVSRNITNGTDGIFNLNGGLLELSQITTVTANGTAANTLSKGIFNFNGGTLRARGSSTTFIRQESQAGMVTPLTVNVRAGGAIIDSNGFNITSVLPLQHDAALGATADGGLTKQGAGTLVLGAANTYTGPTNIQGGRLDVTGSTVAASAVTVNSGTTLGGTGTVGGAVTVKNGGTIGSGTAAGAIGTLTLNGGLTLGEAAGNTSTVEVRPNTVTPTSPSIVVGGALTLNGGAGSSTVEIVGFAPPVGTYRLIDYTGTIGGGSGFSSFTLGGLPPRVVANLVNNVANTSVDLNVSSVDFPVWRGALDGQWNTNTLANPKNWVLASNAATTTDYIEGDQVILDDTATGTTTLDINVADVIPTSVTINNATKNYTIGGAFGIAGEASVTKTGAGSLTILTNNTYTGATTVTGGGTLFIGNGGLTGALGTAAITTDGPLVFNHGAGATITNPAINGTGASVTKNGAGHLIIAGNGNYTGATTINAGVLSTGDDGALGAAPGGNVTVASGASLNIGGDGAGDAANNTDFGQKQFFISGTGANGWGALTNRQLVGTGGNADGSVSGLDQQNAFERVTLNAASSVGGPGLGPDSTTERGRIDIRADAPVGTNPNTAILNLNGNNLTKIGTSKMTLVNADVNGAGDIFVQGGQLGFEGSTKLEANGNKVYFADGTMLQFWNTPDVAATSVLTRPMVMGDGLPASNTFLANGGGDSTVATPIELQGNLIVRPTYGNNNNNNLTLVASITEDGTPRKVTKSNIGLLALNASNNFTGGLEISPGTSVLQAAGTGTVRIGNGSALPSSNVVTFGPITGYTGILELDGFSQTVAGLQTTPAAAGTSVVENASGSPVTFTVNNATNNTFAGIIRDGTGSASLELVKDGAGVLAIAGDSTYTGGTTINAGVLQVGNGGAAGAIGAGAVNNEGILRFNRTGATTVAGSINGSGALEQVGAGTTTLTALNFYSGPTTVSGGTLLVNGSIPNSGTVSVASGGAIGGSGSVGQVTVASGGAISPGAGGVGSTGTLTANSLNVTDGTLRLDFGPTVDLVNANSASFAGANIIAPNGLPVSGTYTIVDSGGNISYAGGTTFTLQPFIVIPGSRTMSGTVDTTSELDKIKVIVSGSKALTWHGNVNNTWDLATPSTGTLNFTDGSIDEKFFNADAVIFSDSSSVKNVSLVSAVQPANVLFSNSGAGYTISGAGSIGGPGAVTQTGSATNTIATNNTFTGQLRVSNGKMILSGNNTIGSIRGDGGIIAITGTTTVGSALLEAAEINIGDGGTTGTLSGPVDNRALVRLTRTNNYTLAANISGGGRVQQQGGGVVTMSGTSPYTGETTINNGTITVTNFQAIGGPAASVSISQGGALDLVAIPTVNLGGGFGGSKIIHISGTGVGGTGALTNSGTLGQQNAYSRIVLDAPATIGGTGRYDLRANTPTLTLQGHTLTKIGTNQFTIVAGAIDFGHIVVNGGTFSIETSTTNTEGGTITMNAGTTLQLFQYNQANGDGIAQTIALNSATVSDANQTHASTLKVPIAMTGTNIFNIQQSTGFNFAGDLTDTGALTKNGNGIMILSGANNSYGGATTVNAGTLRTITGEFGDGKLGAPGSAVVNNATLQLYTPHTLGAVSGTGNTTVGDGTTSVAVEATHVRQGSLTIAGASSVKVAADTGPGGVSKINTLTIAPNAKFDLNSNKLITNSPIGTYNGTAYTGVQGEVARAYDFGAWDLPGLTTSQENAGQNAGPLSGTTTIGVATAEQVLFIGPTDTAEFQGQTVTGASTIAMYTYAGDVNFDGLVDGADYGTLDNWIQFPGTSGYANGDVNYDGVIDGADYGVLDNTIQLQGDPIPGVFGALAGSSGAGGGSAESLSGVTAVPEPSALGFAILGGAALLGRRRRRHSVDSMNV